MTTAVDRTKTFVWRGKDENGVLGTATVKWLSPGRHAELRWDTKETSTKAWWEKTVPKGPGITGARASWTTHKRAGWVEMLRGYASVQTYTPANMKIEHSDVRFPKNRNKNDVATTSWVTPGQRPPLGWSRLTESPAHHLEGSDTYDPKTDKTTRSISSSISASWKPIYATFVHAERGRLPVPTPYHHLQPEAAPSSAATTTGR